jgi:predicted SAM-dependent methyltransferase
MRGTTAKAQAFVDSQQMIRIDIGAGEAIREGWITIDLLESCDLYWDLRRGIPFPDNSVDVVYSSHLMEHMPYDAGQELLRQALRVLKPGGTISICVPNARLYINAYVNGTALPDDHDFWEPALVSREGLDLVNYVAYMGGAHLCMFDEDTLVARLERAGFTEARIRSFDASIDLPEREFESIYAEARKPE